MNNFEYTDPRLNERDLPPVTTDVKESIRELIRVDMEMYHLRVEGWKLISSLREVEDLKAEVMKEVVNQAEWDAYNEVANFVDNNYFE